MSNRSPFAKVAWPSKAIVTGIVLLIIMSPTETIATAHDPINNTGPIEKATNATVLIKTHLKHGFLEDDDATARWTGAGFVIDKDRGLILTNAHVAGYGDSSIRLHFEGESAFISAEKVFLDSKHDVAILRIPSESIPKSSEELELACNYELARGDRVFSLGHPRSQDFTVSFGVLSGSKDFHVDGSFYTTDLITESGSSGGPVALADSGLVVGMNTAGFDLSDIGLITKSSDICPILKLIEQGQNPARPRFGFQTSVVDQKLDPTIGAVFDRSLALKIGDRILAWNRKPWDITQDGDLGDAMRGYTESSVQLTVLRAGKELLIDAPVKAGTSAHEKPWVYFTGLTITEDDKTDARYVMGNTDAPLLAIESLDPNFNDTEDVEFYDGVDIVSVDDLTGMNLQKLYAFLQTKHKEGASVTIVARVFDWTPEAYSYLMTHSFRIEDLNCSWCAHHETTLNKDLRRSNTPTGD